MSIFSKVPWPWKLNQAEVQVVLSRIQEAEDDTQLKQDEAALLVTFDKRLSSVEAELGTLHDLVERLYGAIGRKI